MTDIEQADRFYDALPRVADFVQLTQPEAFTPLPLDWVVATTDSVNSTGEIANGRYKTVNMVGAAVISAMINGLKGHAFPYVFGGDGASFAVPADRIDVARSVLSTLRRWAKETFSISLRAALMPVADIRASGRDARVARFAASKGVDYAMFAGGGVAWVEQQMKLGAFEVPMAAPGAQPDLTGLSCRWSNVQAQNGRILSLVLHPSAQATDRDFADLAQSIVDIASRLERAGHPVPVQGPQVNWPPAGLELEAQISQGAYSVLRRKMRLLVNTLFSWVVFRTGLNVGSFDPDHYARMLSANADYRKFDDGLKMTLDCDADTQAHIERLLSEAEKTGKIRYGVFTQDEAMVTCIVPSAVRDDHVHFIDGAAGGYTQAAAQIKGQF